MRIARVLTRLNLGGPARQVLASDPLLVARGHEVTILAGEPEPGEGDLRDVARRCGLRVVDVPGLRRSPGLFGDRAAAAFLRAELARIAPDLLHTHASKAGLVGRRAAARGAPSAARVHTFHGHVLEGYYPRLVGRGLAELERRLARHTDRLVAVSETTRDDLVRLGVAGSEHIEVVPPGRELGAFLELSPTPANGALRRELGIPSEARLVVVVGRLAPIKRPELALDAFARAARDRADLHLAFAGDGGRTAVRLSAACAALPEALRARVHALGAVPDVAPVFAAADLVLLTSRNEGTPVCLIEAAAAARPFVATAVGGVPELAQRLGSGVCVADGPEAAEELARTLVELLDDPAQRVRLGAAGRERVAQVYGAQALADRLERLYVEVLAEREARGSGAG